MSDSSETLYCGVEGGATHSTLTLFDGQLRPVASVSGPGTNLFQLGIDETCRRIHAMAVDALKATGMAKPVVASVGMSLSGCEREETNLELAAAMRRLFPDLCSTYAVASDTVGTLATASDEGGVVLIAGTGSNALLINPDGSTGRCGGWGHFLGDEGSAIWIAHRACKIYFDHLDNKVLSPHPVKEVERCIKEHFGIKDRYDLLTHCYDRFDKPFFAGLCKRLSESATAGDALAASLFRDAGREMAAHLVAMADQISPKLASAAGGLPVVCIGSVWKSFSLMKDGFVQEIKSNAKGRVKEIRLMHLKVGAPVGACLLGAKKAGISLKNNYEDNTDTFFHTTI